MDNGKENGNNYNWLYRGFRGLICGLNWNIKWNLIFRV